MDGGWVDPFRMAMGWVSSSEAVVPTNPGMPFDASDIAVFDYPEGKMGFDAPGTPKLAFDVPKEHL